MVLKGEIADVPSRLSWGLVQYRISKGSEESIIDIYRYPAPPLHMAIRSGTILFSLLVGIFFAAYESMCLPALLAFAFAFSLLPTPFAPGRPFNFLKHYNPKNITGYYEPFNDY